MTTEHDKKPLVAVFVTGGTIVSRFDTATNTIAPSLSGAQLLATVGAIDFCDIELNEFANMPGPHITPQMGLSLAKAVQTALDREEISGAVVLQGTDTLEEIAYLFHLIVKSEKPVVFSGAMKSLHEPYTDAKGNLLGALRLAASRQARGRGILVYFNQEILPARYAVKSNANNMDSFRAVETGTMGVINNQTIVFFNRIEPHEHYDVSHLDADIQLIKVVSGMSALLIDACVDMDVDGIVIEGFGAGNFPPGILPSIRRGIERGIPIVVATRCIGGFATGSYSYEGGGAHLQSLGVLSGGDLSGQKARIKLMVLCSVSRDLSYIAAHM